ncbi:MAG: hypothetical protein ACYDBX_03780, partial [Patescibacteria group bacterium]
TKTWLISQRKEVISKAIKSDEVEGLRIANETLDVLEGYAGMNYTDTSTATEVIEYGAIDAGIPQPALETTEVNELEEHIEPPVELKLAEYKPKVIISND